MPPVDYMKVVDIISRIFNAKKTVDLKATHEKVDIFDISTTSLDGKPIAYRILLNGFTMEIILPKDLFNTIRFEKWQSMFEYEMEQAFLSNIRLEVRDQAGDYHIITTF